MEIKTKEVLVSVIIFFVMIAVGFPISNKVTENAVDEAEFYQKALKIKDTETFNYAVDTRQGNLIAEGDFKAVDEVKFDEMTKSFMYVERVKQKYVMKTRHIPAVKDSKGKTITPARTETYWEWDTVGRDEVISKKLSFHGNEYDVSKFSLISNQQVEAVDIVKATNGGWLDSGRYYYESKSIRYRYYVIPSEFSASLIATASDKGLEPVKSEKKIRISESNAHSLVKQANDSVKTASVFFWGVWIIISGLLIYGFIALENKYLD